MAPARHRLPRTDDRYGHICPGCAGPKTVQAARCFPCYRDDLLNGLARTGPSWNAGTGTPRVATGRSSARPQPQSHPWRKLIARDVELARRRAAA